MTTYKAFTYEEVLTETGKKGVSPSLLITDDSPPLLLIIRLLSGSTKLTNNFSNIEINCRKNYFANDLKNFGQQWQTKFPSLISGDITSDDIGKFISDNKNVNRAFYTHVLNELSHFIYESKKSSHTAAFIFIYRLLEKVAYAFPMIYASKTQDFVHSFTHLKEMMSGDSKKSELGFFKKFVETLYKDHPIFITSVDMYFYDQNAEIQEQLYTEVQNCLEEGLIHEDSVNPIKLSIKYAEMGSFIISIRNRFFHNMNNHTKNIQSQNVADCDLLFVAINDSAMQWISTLILGILSHSIDQYQLIKGE